MTVKFPVCLLAALATALPLAPLAAATPAADVRPGQYRVEPGHTQVTFSLLHMGFTPYAGLFAGASGTLRLDPALPAASRLNVTVPIDSITTTSSVLTTELRGPDWFDAARYPTATFVSSRVVPVGADHASVTGDLTLHGVTRPVVLQVQYVGAGINPIDKAYTVGFQATTTIQRSAFGMKTYLPMVGDEVSLSIAGAFEKQD
ncbi:YceI family protein [Komagataeibacter sp. AV436]|uniref:YceI family protein n=1 Tax=Komagataeibacter melomenusus TaxID=2766578 RepID=A0ABX2AC02_9PROT|nr:YceI family protein [Komagataeibacter melomenusus]MBV1829652.1 YceI family protein [Komagataeibacter melomenusus]NPC65147.1 YceI family protein [Komagataeibacter melomenusus]